MEIRRAIETELENVPDNKMTSENVSDMEVETVNENKLKKCVR